MEENDISVILATPLPLQTRPVRISNSLRKKYDVSFLNPIIEPKVTERFGRVTSAALRWPLYSLQVLVSKSDIIHFFASPNFVAMPILYKKCKFVFDFRASFHEELETEFHQNSLSNFAYWVETKLVKRANVILTVNEIFAEKIKKRYGLKPHLVPNYPPKSFVPFRSRREVRGEVTKPIVLFIGNFEFYHDFANLLKCARKMRDCEFWLIGDGTFRGWVQQHASSNVKIFGYVPHKEIPNFINACDIGVVPMKSYTKTPLLNDQDLLKVGELASLCKPIVATGVAPSSQYLLVKQDELDKGIREALSGRVPLPIPHYWEDYSEKTLFEVYSRLD